ncbi:hypothetical protein IFM89_006839 [Coptis chinensis]|uniref:Fiber protein Fb15 n=1 Tax=Coptis chinensis TaxID=261450 RepID=A0A835M457_9MAGN|nr:hypothetical protein IFM89_006839 [Coptis chinensis]
MAMRKLYSEIKGLKVRELPSYLKPRLTIEKVKEAINKGMDNYHKKYILTSSPDPIYHVCFGGMIFSYLVALPEERRHLAHAQEHAAH